MQKNEIETFIQKYLSHELNEQEFEELKRWIEEDASHKKTFVQLLSLRHVNNQLNLLHQFDKDASWEALQKRCTRRRLIRRRITIYSAAAAVAALIGIASLLYFNHRNIDPVIADNKARTTSITKHTPPPKATWVLANQSTVSLYQNQQEINGTQINNGEITFPQESDNSTQAEPDADLLRNQILVPKGSEYSIVLSDGSKVKMNADSHLDFPVQFGEIREVSLEGEAFFDVTHEASRPFIIKAHDHTVYVLGTTFNVTAYPNEEVSVTLVNGKLKVISPSGEYYLSSGEHYSSSHSSVSKVDTEFYTSWTNGIMEFDAMPFPLLVARLSRCYDVDIKIASKELETMKFTGVIFRNKPLDFALDIIQRVSDVQFEKKDKTILVKKQ